jgi:hypothetical protein
LNAVPSFFSTKREVGYRELRARLQLEIGNARGDQAVRAMALAMRAFAHERPGLSAATFRNSIIDSPEWRRESELLGGRALRAFESAGLCREQAMKALRILRALGSCCTKCRNLSWRMWTMTRATAPLSMSLFEDWMYFGPLN